MQRRRGQWALLAKTLICQRFSGRLESGFERDMLHETHELRRQGRPTHGARPLGGGSTHRGFRATAITTF